MIERGCRLRFPDEAPAPIGSAAQSPRITFSAARRPRRVSGPCRPPHAPRRSARGARRAQPRARGMVIQGFPHRHFTTSEPSSSPGRGRHRSSTALPTPGLSPLGGSSATSVSPLTHREAVCAMRPAEVGHRPQSERFILPAEAIQRPSGTAPPRKRGRCGRAVRAARPIGSADADHAVHVSRHDDAPRRSTE